MAEDSGTLERLLDGASGELDHSVLLRLVIDHSRDGLLILDARGHVVLANAAAGAVLGPPPQVLEGSPLGTPVGGQEPVRMNVVHPEQGLRFIEFHNTAFDRPEGDRWHLVTFRDMTEEILVRRREEDVELVSHAIAHDLREPVRMMVSYLDLLERRGDQAFDDDTSELLGFARDGAHRLDSMLEGLLAYVRTEGRIQEPGPTELGEAVDAALANLQAKAKSSDLEISYDQLPRTLGDRDQLSLVFQNLISNAITYMPDGRIPRIKIEAERADGVWAIGVKDNGHGIPPDQQDRIFDLFYRDRESPGHPEGSGMGLAICKRIVENHGGRIWVESDPPDGATFWFTLPAVAGSQDQVPGPVPSPVRRPVGEEGPLTRDVEG